MSNEDLPNNLRLDKDGNIFCQNGQDTNLYISKYRANRNKALGIATSKTPISIVIVTREDFLELTRELVELRSAMRFRESLDLGLIFAA